MMLKIGLVLALLAVPTLALADPPKTAQKTYLDFNGTTVDGSVEKPNGTVTLHRKKTAFRSLMPKPPTRLDDGPDQMVIDVPRSDAD